MKYTIDEDSKTVVIHSDFTIEEINDAFDDEKFSDYTFTVKKEKTEDVTYPDIPNPIGPFEGPYINDPYKWKERTCHACERTGVCHCTLSGPDIKF